MILLYHTPDLNSAGSLDLRGLNKMQAGIWSCPSPGHGAGSHVRGEQRVCTKTRCPPSLPKPRRAEGRGDEQPDVPWISQPGPFSGDYPWGHV